MARDAADQAGSTDAGGRTADATPHACDGALRRAFALLGKRWSGVILGTLAIGPVGFSELRRSVIGISDSMLSERLAELTAARLIQRIVDQGPPLAVAYRLAPAGEALLPVLNDLTQWAADNLPESVATA